MARKRKDGYHLEIPDINDVQSYIVERNEMMKLTKVAKSWEFTCSFCFKKFPSAQAMGGHQNAHRGERLEEKKKFVRDPIAYRKRAFLLAMKAQSSGVQKPSLNLHAATRMVKHELKLAKINGQPKILPKPIRSTGDLGEFNAAANNYIYQPSNSKNLPLFNVNGENMKSLPFVMNFFPPKELNLAESIGIHAEDSKGKKCIEFGIGGCGINLEKLDLTLRLGIN
ncbi:hypothetical protein BUALT_Bualt12G0003300 [Buddleja alternifolia]|uniref:C2H2-type domain-containing protein n=1 Tax=Buddleja alternifolia TaxID=168488 RepID=A0AAV6WVM1_9LAMI|nr:hypothetical protein BUALT_Bualt12G0003300 [Buddleja alternifolia]